MGYLSRELYNLALKRYRQSSGWQSGQEFLLKGFALSVRW